MAQQLAQNRKFAFLVDEHVNSSRQQTRPDHDLMETSFSQSNPRAKSIIQIIPLKDSSTTEVETIPLNDISTISTSQISFRSNMIPVSTKTSPFKCLIIGTIVAIIIVILITLGIVLPIVLTRNPTVTDWTTTSTTPPIATETYWSFDNHVNDQYGTYNGMLINGASYSTPTYFGYGANLLFNSTLNQSVVVPSPFLNLSYTSFTVEAWIFVRTFTGDNAIFSQCQCSSCQDQCLHLIIRNARMYMGFTLDDLVGVNTVPLNAWTHVAYVYDYSTRTQSIYLQGVLDNSKTSAGPYQGQSGSILIGSSHLSSSSFNGFMDNVKLTTRAKTSKEIMDAASLVTYFSFDGTTVGQDMGPNQMNGTISNVAAVTGRVGQGLAFTGLVTSYLQLYGYFQLGRSNQPYTFSLWIYPYSTTGGVLIQKNDSPSAPIVWCTTLMGISNAGQIGVFGNASPRPLIIGPMLAVRTWTHIGYTYSTTNGIRMYINGILFGSTGPITFSSSNTMDWLNIGSFVTSYCGTGSLSPTPYQGAIDEFYVYRRELTEKEIIALANP